KTGFKSASCARRKRSCETRLSCCLLRKVQAWLREVQRPGLYILSADEDGKDVDNILYKQMVGCLRYAFNSRPDICHTVGVVSRFMQSPKLVHMQAVKRIMRHLQGTIDHGILFPKPKEHESKLTGFCDSDRCGDQVERRSTMRYIHSEKMEFGRYHIPASRTVSPRLPRQQEKMEF
ncbi:hypothetical protein L195_g038163, partial [Trifolium pratense]